MQPLQFSPERSANQWPKHFMMANEMKFLHPRRLYYLAKLMRLAEELGCKLTIYTNPLHTQLIAQFKERTPYVERQLELAEHIRSIAHRGVSVHSFLTPSDFGGDDADFYDGVHMGRHNGDILMDYLMAKDL